MARARKIQLDGDKIKNHKKASELRPNLGPSGLPVDEATGRFVVKIEAAEFTSNNLGYVLANLRFYMFDARNYDNPGKFPFKIYEHRHELMNPNQALKVKVAEFTTKKDCEEALAKIKETWRADFDAKYELTSRTSPGTSGRGVRKRLKQNVDKPMRTTEENAIPDAVPVPAPEQTIPLVTERLTGGVQDVPVRQEPKVEGIMWTPIHQLPTAIKVENKQPGRDE